MHRRLMGNSTMLGSSAEPKAQTVSPAIMVAKAGAIGIERRLQAKTARVPENTAAMPMGIASGMLWNVIISAPTRPGQDGNGRSIHGASQDCIRTGT